MPGSAVSGQFINVSYPSPHVAHVELSRKPVNSFNDAVWTEFGHIFDTISQDPDIRAVALSSSLPKLFTAGLDLKALGSLETSEREPARSALQLRDHIIAFQSGIAATERCPYPVIAAVHGSVIGLGIDILSACDIRFTASDATFSIKEVDVGLAADIGTLARIPKITGNESFVRELAFTARSFSAQEALSMGFVSKIVSGSRAEVVSAALETAQVIATKSPIAVMGTKQILLHARDHSVEDNLKYTAIWNAAMLQTADVKEAMSSFLKKKPPKFLPLRKIAPKL